MSGGEEPLVVIPLRDGSTMRLTANTLRVGDRQFAIAQIQDARQVAPDPETIALRIGGAGLVEFQPSRPGDGAVALETLFRMRPNLRPAGFQGPAALPPGVPPIMPPASPNAAGVLPLNMPPAPEYIPFGASDAAPPPYPPFYPVPDWQPYPPGPRHMPGAQLPYPPGALPAHGALTPFPRGIVGTLGAIFEIFGAYWWRWVLLGLCTAGVATALSGGIKLAALAGLGLNPWGATPLNAFGMSVNPTTGAVTVTNTLPSLEPARLLTAGVVALVLVLALVVVSAWQAAALARAARAALIGERPRVGASLRGGLRRLLPVLGTSIVVGLINLVLLVATLACIGVSIASALLTAPSSGTVVTATGSPLLLVGCVTGLLSIPLLLLYVYIRVRLLLAIYIAAIVHVGPGTAVAQSWRLTRRNWWRTFIPVVVAGFVGFLAAYTLGAVQYASYALSVLVIVPLVMACVAPLSAIAAMTVLAGLRLRREGYAALMQSLRPAAPATVPRE